MMEACGHSQRSAPQTFQTIERSNFILPPNAACHRLPESALADGILEASCQTVGNNRNLSANPIERPGRWRRMSRPPFGVAKGRCGRLCAASQLPVHQEGQIRIVLHEIIRSPPPPLSGIRPGHFRRGNPRPHSRRNPRRHPAASRASETPLVRRPDRHPRNENPRTRRPQDHRPGNHADRLTACAGARSGDRDRRRLPPARRRISGRQPAPPTDLPRCHRVHLRGRQPAQP